MIDRIRKIMEEEGMSSGKFADEVGIIDSRLSHYLSRRNKVTLELVTKILERFRGINSEWLLFGRGEMYKSADAKGAYREPDLFSPQPARQESPLNDNKADNSYSNITSSDFFEPEQVKTAENDIETTDQYLENQNVDVRKISSKQQREIEKIIVMYSDFTFDSYTPNGHKI